MISGLPKKLRKVMAQSLSKEPKMPSFHVPLGSRYSFMKCFWQLRVLRQEPAYVAQTVVRKVAPGTSAGSYRQGNSGTRKIWILRTWKAKLPKTTGHDIPKQPITG